MPELQRTVQRPRFRGELYEWPGQLSVRLLLSPSELFAEAEHGLGDSLSKDSLARAGERVERLIIRLRFCGGHARSTLPAA